jgi:hypothetical protein
MMIRTPKRIGRATSVAASVARRIVRWCGLVRHRVAVGLLSVSDEILDHHDRSVDEQAEVDRAK